MPEEIKFYPMPPMSRRKWWFLFFLNRLFMLPGIVAMLFAACFILPFGVALLALMVKVWKEHTDIFYVTYPFMGRKVIGNMQEKKLVKTLRKYRRQQTALIKREGTAEQYLRAKNAAKRKSITLGEAKKFYWEHRLSSVFSNSC